MKGLTRENVKEAYEALKEIERKDLKRKVFILKFYYFSAIATLLFICALILIRG